MTFAVSLMTPSAMAVFSCVKSRKVSNRMSAGWFRVMYIAKFEETVYVLHSFQKKANKTSQGDKDVAKRRYGAVLKERKTK